MDKLPFHSIEDCHHQIDGFYCNHDRLKQLSLINRSFDRSISSKFGNIKSNFLPNDIHIALHYDQNVINKYQEEIESNNYWYYYWLALRVINGRLQVDRPTNVGLIVRSIKDKNIKMIKVWIDYSYDMVLEAVIEVLGQGTRFIDPSVLEIVMNHPELTNQKLHHLMKCSLMYLERDLSEERCYQFTSSISSKMIMYLIDGKLITEFDTEEKEIMENIMKLIIKYQDQVGYDIFEQKFEMCSNTIDKRPTNHSLTFLTNNWKTIGSLVILSCGLYMAKEHGFPHSVPH